MTGAQRETGANPLVSRSWMIYRRSDKLDRATLVSLVFSVGMVILAVIASWISQVHPHRRMLRTR